MKMILAVAACLICAAGNLSRQSATEQKGDKQASPAACPMHDAHTQMNERGEKGMGFSQTATTHHFLLSSKGGVIQLETIDPADTTNRDRIRMHLAHIAEAFRTGDFDIPIFVHDTVPPGVPEMKRLQKTIQYSFEQTPNGGRLVISSSDKEATDAIHRFLRFQIDEHKTGDPTVVR